MSGNTRRQQLASLMQTIHEGGKLRQHEDEPTDDYFSRLRKKAVQVQRHQRAARRKDAAAARKGNR